MPTIAALKLNNDMNFALWFEIDLKDMRQTLAKNLGIDDNIKKRNSIGQIEFMIHFSLLSKL